MIPAIPPVPAMPPLSVTGAPDAASSAPPSGNLIDRFASIMQNLEAAPPARAHAHGPSAIGQFVAAQDGAAKATLENVRGFSISETGSMAEVATGVMRMQTELAMLTFKLNIANALVGSAKSSVQTLMKNQ